jgi:hypothetical protein
MHKKQHVYKINNMLAGKVYIILMSNKKYTF